MEQSSGLSKIEYWKKWGLFELFEDLDKAAKLLDELADNSEEDRFKKFEKEFIEELYEVKGSNLGDFTTMWEWFTPNKEWDIMTGKAGKDLGTKIFVVVDRWKRNQDFLPGTKVSLGDEYGVVLPKVHENDLAGLIRWDTKNSEDVEDWRGLFGSFLQAGGIVVGPEYEFSLINDDGTLKRYHLQHLPGAVVE